MICSADTKGICVKGQHRRNQFVVHGTIDQFARPPQRESVYKFAIHEEEKRRRRKEEDTETKRRRESL